MKNRIIIGSTLSFIFLSVSFFSFIVVVSFLYRSTPGRSLPTYTDKAYPTPNTIAAKIDTTAMQYQSLSYFYDAYGSYIKTENFKIIDDLHKNYYITFTDNSKITIVCVYTNEYGFVIKEVEY